MIWRSFATACLVAAWLPAAAAPGAVPSTWLAAHSPVRFAPERDYGPFIYADAEGRVVGLSVDLLAEVSRHTGLALVTQPPQPLSRVLAAARDRQADLVSALRPTPERSQYLLFTQPYVSVPAVLVVRAGEGVPASLAGYAGQAVAVGAGYAVEAVVRAAWPQVRWVPVPDDVVALHGLAEGRYAAVVTDTASLGFIARRDGLDTLAAADHVGFEYTLSFAVRSDWPELRDIIDEGLRAIPAARRRDLVEKWVPALEAGAVEPRRAPWATRLAIALIGVGLLVALAHGPWRSRGR